MDKKYKKNIYTVYKKGLPFVVSGFEEEKRDTQVQSFFPIMSSLMLHSPADFDCNLLC